MNFKKTLVLVGILMLSTLFSCPSEDDCMKTITIPQTYFVGNQSYTNDTTLEVPCDFPEPTEPEIIEAPVLENFTYQILNYNYIPYSDNNTTILQYEIKLNNHNDYPVTGFPKITFYDGNFEMSGNFSENAIEPCYEIGANSSCILTSNQEHQIEQVLPLDIYEIVNVEYIVTN